MELALILQKAGIAQIAAGQTLWPWNFALAKPEEVELWVGEGGLYLQTITVSDALLPTRDQAIGVAALREEQQKLRAETEKKVGEIETRVQQLLCLEAPRVVAQSEDDDIPF